MANLKYGSQGDDVKKMQQALIDAGYDVGKTGADGVVGKNTVAAIKQYQKDNGLAVDGIAGKNTLGKLYGTTTTTTPKTTTTTTPTTTPTPTPTAPATPQTNTDAPATNQTASGFTYDEFTYDPFTYDNFNAQEDPLIQEANAALAGHMNGKPGDYTSLWQDEMDSYLSQYENRDPFSYDFNSDALYNQYKDQYILQGQMAMMDTMGQAAAMTGGYGNSYAQTVGQQAYNQQLNQLNEIMPQLYQMAYDRYNQEGQDLLNMYNIYAGLDERDYGRYRDETNDWYTMLDYYTNNANTVYDRQYGEWLDKTNLDLDNWKTTTGLELDKWSTETGINQDEYWKKIDQDYKVKRDEIEDNQWQQQFNQTEEQIAKSDEDAAWNKLVDLMGTGYEPTKKELAAAGMTPEQAKAIQNSYASQKSGASGVELSHIASMSSYELTGYLNDYKKKEDNAGLETFLDDCVATGRLTETQADEYYAKYRTGNDGGPGGTEVDPTSYDGVRASVLEMANGEGKWMEIDNALLKAKRAGYITEAEYKKLRDEAAKTRQNYAQGKYTK